MSAKLTRAELEQMQKCVEHPNTLWTTKQARRLIAHVRAQEEQIKKRDEALREIGDILDDGKPTTPHEIAAALTRAWNIARAARMEE